MPSRKVLCICGPTNAVFLAAGCFLAAVGLGHRVFPCKHPGVNGVNKWILVFLTFALLVAGCSHAPASGSEAASAPSSKEQVLRLSLMDEPPELDAQKTTDAVSIDILNAVQEGLVRIGPDGKPRPGMAERWDVSQDGMVYTFTLRKDAKWSNGDPVTAQDFLAGWKKVLAPETASEYAFLLTDYIAGAKEYADYQRYQRLVKEQTEDPAGYQKAYGDKTPAEVVYGKKIDTVPQVTFDAVGIKNKDDHTLEITLLKPIPYIYELLAFPIYFPFHEKFYVEHREKYASDVSELLYNGPFLLEEWVHGSKVVLTKNPNYWDRDSVSLDRITFDVLKDVNTAVRLYEGEQIDRVVLSGDLAPKYRQRDDYHVFVEYFTYFLMFNFEKPPFQNEKVRKALAYAVDRKSYVETVLQNGSPPAYGLVPESEPAWAGADTTFRDWSKRMFGGLLFQDVGENPALKEEAKKLLEEGLRESGIPVEKFRFTLLHDDNETTRKAAEFLKASWKQILGIDVDLKQVTFKDRLARMRQGDFEVAYTRWGADYNDPETWLGLFETGGAFNWGEVREPRLRPRAGARPFVRNGL